MLAKWLKEEDVTADELNRFITTIIKNVVLLPIECNSRDDALTIFNTLNDRGLPLGDADIFKAELFKSVMTDINSKNELIKRWNLLNKNNQIESLFRDYMHIIRADNGEIGREIAMRKYYLNSKKIFNLYDWKKILSALEKLNKDNKEYESSFPYDIENMWNLLTLVPNDYCQYPVKVYWYKNAILKDGRSILPENKQEEFKLLIKRAVKYYFLYAVAYNAVNTIKDTTYKVCEAIAHNNNYLEHFKNKYDDVYIDFERKITEYKYGRCRKGLVMLLALLNKYQKPEKIYNLQKSEVEHILPQTGGYNNYNGWTEEQYEDKLNTLGNYVLLEKPLNIKASNEFFKKKKEEYKHSAIQDALDLVKLDDWKYDDWEKRNKEREEIILKYFKIID